MTENNHEYQQQLQVQADFKKHMEQYAIDYWLATDGYSAQDITIVVQGKSYPLWTTVDVVDDLMKLASNKV